MSEKSLKHVAAPGSVAWGNNLRTQIRNNVKQLDELYFHLGKFLYLIWNTPEEESSSGAPYYQQWGYDTFSQYVEEELDLDDRTATRLRKIWYNLEVECDQIRPELRQDLIHLGRGKMRELARILTNENAEMVYADTKSLTVSQTQLYVQKFVKGQQQEEREAAEAVKLQETGVFGEDRIRPAPERIAEHENFRLFSDQKETLETAMERARDLLGTPDAKKGHCLEMICNDFLANNDFAAAHTEEHRERYLAKMEKTMKVRLVAIDPKSGHILWGMDTLHKLAHREVD